MKIRIIFRGNSLNYYLIENEKVVKLMGLIDFEGNSYRFMDFSGYCRDYNKTIIR